MTNDSPLVEIHIQNSSDIGVIVNMVIAMNLKTIDSKNRPVKLYVSDLAYLELRIDGVSFFEYDHHQDRFLAKGDCGWFTDISKVDRFLFIMLTEWYSSTSVLF